MTGTQIARAVLRATPTTAQMVALMKAMQAEDPKSFDFRVKFDLTTPKYGRQQDGNTPLQLAEMIRQALGGGCELDEIMHVASMITLGSESASRWLSNPCPSGCSKRRLHLMFSRRSGMRSAYGSMRRIPTCLSFGRSSGKILNCSLEPG